MLKAENLQKTYRGRQVVKNVSLSVNAGEVVGLLGPNGAGKTTCFYMTVGLVQHDAGDIYLNDKRVSHLSMADRARAGVGYLPQEASIFRRLSVADNIAAVLECRDDLTNEERKNELSSLLDEFHLNHVATSLGVSLSGGERRRAEIARALAAGPKFILLDEPFAGVDPISIMDIKREIRALSTRGIGVLITDHNVRETLAICHRATIITSGSVLAEGSPDEILANPQVRQIYLGEEFEL